MNLAYPVHVMAILERENNDETNEILGFIDIMGLTDQVHHEGQKRFRQVIER